MKQIRQYIPDSLLLEQLYSQLDLLGQIQAMRSLVLDRRGVIGLKADAADAIIDCGGETLPEQRLRLRALVDILVNAQNDLQVSHSLLARCEAAYSIAQWQIFHAPETDPSSSAGCLLEMSENEGVTAWVGMDILIGCIRNMFMEKIDIQVKSSIEKDGEGDNGGKLKDEMKTTLFPLPNDLGSYEKTYLRDALLQALASIKAKNGQTPLKVVELLLNFAENNDNLGASSSLPSGLTAENGGEKDKAEARASFNDGQYCSLLMLCLCQVQLAVVSNRSLAPNDQHIHKKKQQATIVSMLKRIIAVSTYFLHREQIMLACLKDDGTADERCDPPPINSSIIKNSRRRDVTSDARRGIISKDSIDQKMSEMNNNGSNGNQAATPQRMPSSPGGGMVASTALQCICHAEIQLSRVLSNNPANNTPSKVPISGRISQDRRSRVAEFLADSSINEPFKFDYDPFLNEHRWPVQVRCSAIDAKVSDGYTNDDVNYFSYFSNA